jgi:DnaK suppressor protein
MARRDALLRMHQNLMSRRSELYKRLGIELRDMGKSRGAGSGDSADVAFDAGSEELSSKLAELEARELRQIERALTKMKQGSYGTCELCQTKIPVERLNALPYSTMCVKCQREVENSNDWEFNAATGSWENVSESDPFEDRKRLDLSDLEYDYSK